LPIALLGTAVAFVVGFKNNASYDRLWEARRVWGAIVNASRTWGLMARDYVSDRHATSPTTPADIAEARRACIGATSPGSRPCATSCASPARGKS
jgi:putative membrane protein